MSNGFKMAFGASPYSYAAGKWMFEHCEAVLTPPGGGAVDHSPSRPAHLAPYHDIRYSRCLPEPVWCVKSENVFGGLHVCERSVRRCLSIVELSRHHPVVGRSIIHRADPLTWSRTTISVTPGAFLSRLVRQIRERIWWSARV